MLFIERLTRYDLDSFCRELANKSPKANFEDWIFKIKDYPDFKRITLSIKNVTSYTIILDIYDFSLKIWNPGLLEEDFILNAFSDFMYRTFGEEYNPNQVDITLLQESK